MSKIARNKWIDILWATAVKVMAGYRCERCGSPRFLAAHHFINRNNNLAMRWELANGFCLCERCHGLAGKNKKEFQEWAISKRGMEWFEVLYRVKNMIKPVVDIEEIRRELKEVIKKGK